MTRKFTLLALLLVAASECCSRGSTDKPLPTQVVIQAEYMGWTSGSTNLTLIWSNGVYAAGAHTVGAAVVSNLIAVARRPWPRDTSTTQGSVSIRRSIDPANLGLDATWIKANHQRLLAAFSGDSAKGVFPNASDRQRAWLTNALSDLELLGEVVRSYFEGLSWTDDYPSLELRFENDDGQTVEQVFRLNTRAQHSFMLPWNVCDGTNELTSGDAEISRAVVQLLPPGFMHRDRLNGDLLQILRQQFPSCERVQQYLKKSTLEETLGADSDRLLQAFELRKYWMPGGDTWMASLHRTNWPARLTMPIQANAERGVVKNLRAILDNADARVAPVLKLEWVVSRLNGPSDFAVEVNPEGSPDHQWLRGHMEKAGLKSFYDRIQPSLSHGLGFVMREGFRRSSQWAILEDGRVLLYGFAGNGVLDWTPAELGFKGISRALDSFSIHNVGVFVGPDGKIVEIAWPEAK